MERLETYSWPGSFVFDFGEDEPLSEQDLLAIEAIEAQFLSSQRNKRPLNPTEDDGVTGVATSSADSSRHTRRRLPKSILDPQSLWPPRGYERMSLPEMKFTGQILYGKTANGVEKVAMELLNVLEAKKREKVQIALGFDIEWRPSFRRGVSNGKVAVMQICDGTDHCHVLHIIHSGIPRSLQLLLEDPTILKVGANIANDARKIFKDYEIYVKGLEDLSFHANQKLGGKTRNWCLSSLTEKLLSKQLPKPSKIRLGNWETCPLSKEQIEYAATDAFASWYLYQAMRDLPNAKEAVAEERRDAEGVMQK